MSRTFSALVCFAGFGLFASVGFASPITFTASGTTQDGASLSGNVVIDTALGTVTSLSLTLSSPDFITFSSVATYGDSGIPGVQLIRGWNGTNFPTLTLLFPGTTLVGFAGEDGCIVGGSGCDNDPSFFLTGESTGSNFTALNLTSAAVPEPTSVALLGGALLGLGAWRRKRNRA